MSTTLLSASMVSAAMLFNTDSIIADKSVRVLQAGIAMAQDPGSQIRTEVSLLSLSLEEEYYTRFSRKAKVVSLSLPDVRLGFRYVPSDTGYKGFYDFEGDKWHQSIASTLYYVQGGYSALPGAGTVARASAGLWDRDTVRRSEGGISLEATQQKVSIDGVKMEVFRTASVAVSARSLDFPFSFGMSIKYSEDLPNISLVRNNFPGEYNLGQDKAVVRSHRKNLDFLLYGSNRMMSPVGPGWVRGLEFNFSAGMRNVLAWEDLRMVGKFRLAGVVDGDSLLLEDGPLSMVGSTDVKLTVGYGWIVPHLGNLILLSVNARAYISGVELYCSEVYKTSSTDSAYYTRPGLLNPDGTQLVYTYTLQPRTMDVGLQISWGLSFRL